MFLIGAELIFWLIIPANQLSDSCCAGAIP
jgi:hypothetical protein